MTFIVEAIKGDHHTSDIRGSGIDAVILARKLAADGFTVSILSPTGARYSADKFNLLLTGKCLSSQGAAEWRCRIDRRLSPPLRSRPKCVAVLTGFLDGRNDVGARARARSIAGVPAAILADIAGRALAAMIGRRAVVIGEGAGLRAGAVIMEIADLVGQRPMMAD